MTFGEKLKEFRESKKLTQEDLGKLVGMTKQRISRYENSVRNPRLVAVQTFADALEIPVTDLFGQEEPVPTPTRRLTNSECMEMVSNVLMAEPEIQYSFLCLSRKVAENSMTPRQRLAVKLNAIYLEQQSSQKEHQEEHQAAGQE